MKRLLLPLHLLLLSNLTSFSSTLWTEDFESFKSIATANPAPSPLISKSGISWTANPAVLNAHRIYPSSNFNMSPMWVSNQFKTTLTSSGTPVTPATTYTFTFFGALDFRLVGASGSLLTEILVGPSISKAKTVASKNYTITGAVEGQVFNKESAMHQISTAVTENTPNNKIFIRFTVNTTTTKYWTAIDDISLTSKPGNNSAPQANTSQNPSAVDGTLISIGGISVQMK